MADRQVTDADPRIDRDRGAVYRAEDQVARIMAAPHRRVRLEGRIVTLPADPPFADLPAMQRFVDEVLAGAAVRGLGPGEVVPGGPVTVRPGRGFRRASYREGVITIPLADPRGRWAMTRAVLLHELAHHLAGEPGHGPQFRARLVALYRARLGEPAAELLVLLLAPLDDLPEPAGSLASGQGSDQVRRVAALLAKAQSTASAPEAEAYLAKAAEVAQRHSLDLAVAALGGAPRAEAPTHRMLTIGRPREALNKQLVALYLAIARAWPVQVDIGPGSTYVLGYGMPADLDQVESVFATASALMVQGADAHRRGRSWVGATYRPSPGGPLRPVTATVARNAFVLGFVERVAAKIAESAQAAREAAERGQGGTGPATPGSGIPGAGPAAAPRADRARESPPAVEIALRARELAVAEYHRSASRARGSWQGSLSAAGTATGSRLAGRRAADALGRQRLAGGRPAIEG